MGSLGLPTAAGRRRRRGAMPDLYAPALPAPKKKRVPRKCSTCSNRKCRTRGIIVDWVDCENWRDPLDRFRKS